MSSLIRVVVDGSLSEGQSRSFYNPSTRSKLKSFEDMTHKTKQKCRSGDTVNPELVFRRELVLANCREDVTVEKVLSNSVKTDLDRRSLSSFLIEFWMSYLSKISTTTDVNWKQEIWFFTKSSAISPKALNLFAFIDCNKGMSKKGNHFTWPVYFLILKQLKCWIRMVF
jgi:hypothetical protein